MKKSICIIDNGGAYSDHRIYFVRCSLEVAHALVNVKNTEAQYTGPYCVLGEANPQTWAGEVQEPEDFLYADDLIEDGDPPKLIDGAKRLPKRILEKIANRPGYQNCHYERILAQLIKDLPT
jgi:hypothetical protein